MPDGENKKKDRFGYLVVIVTIAVSLWSLYFSSVQAQIARKSFDLGLSKANADIEKQFAELHTLLADKQKGQDSAGLLERLAQLQTQIAERQAKFADQHDDKEIAGIHQGLGNLEKDLAQLQRDRDAKQKEIESLRGKVARLEELRALAPTAASGTPSKPTLMETLGDRGLIPAGSVFMSPSRLGEVRPFALSPGLGSALRSAAEPQPPAETSGIARFFADLWAAFRKSPVPSVYFGIALLIALGKLFK